MSSTKPKSQTELRASVLDAAIDLGFRSSSFSRWMSDSIAEVDDTEVDESNPGLTTTPSSTTTSRSSHADSTTLSDDYGFDYGDPHPITSSIMRSRVNDRVAVVEAEDFKVRAGRDDKRIVGFAVPESGTPWNGDVTIIKEKKEKRGGFRKARQLLGVAADSDSDGGYISEATREKSVKANAKSKKKKKKRSGEDVETEYESDGGYLSEATAPRKVLRKTRGKPTSTKTKEQHSDPETFLANINASLLPPDAQQLSLSRSLSPAVHADLNTGYLTDATSTPSKKSKKKDKRDEIDALDTPSKKRNLFRMVTSGREKSKERKERNKTEEADVVPPVPSVPLVLPIADRFARSTTPLPAAQPLGSDASTRSDSAPGHFFSSRDNFSSTSGTPFRLSADSDTRPVGLGIDDWNATAMLRGMSISPFENLRPSNESYRLTNEESTPKFIEGPLLSKSRSASPQNVSLAPPPASLIDSSPGKSPNRKRNLFTRRQNSASSTTTEESAVSHQSHGLQGKVTGKFSNISVPNPHLAAPKVDDTFSSPLELVAALTTKNNSAMSHAFSGMENFSSSNSRGSHEQRFFDDTETEKSTAPWNKTRERKATGGEETLQSSRGSTLSIVVPSSSYIVPSPGVSPIPPSHNAGTLLAPPSAAHTPSSPGYSSLAARRSLSPRPLTPSAIALPVTPTRLSVLAYYDVPPRSPEPTSPLPSVPTDAVTRTTTKSDTSITHQSSEEPERPTFLSPGMSMFTRSLSPSRQPSLQAHPTSVSPTPSQSFPASVSPSPLTSRSPSPNPGGLFAQPIPSVKRGKQSPFPARPVLPKDDNSTLSNLIARRPTLTIRAKAQASRSASDEKVDGFVYDDDEGDPIEPLDDNELAEREARERARARARGEKRVFFSESTPEEDEREDDVYAGLVQIDEPAWESRPNDSASAFETSRDIHVDEFQDEFEDDRSLYTDGDADERSIYSRYSVLDADRSAEMRDRFVDRVMAVYEGAGGRLDVMPPVPELPVSLRDVEPSSMVVPVPIYNNLVLERRGILKASSPYRF